MLPSSAVIDVWPYPVLDVLANFIFSDHQGHTFRSFAVSSATSTESAAQRPPNPCHIRVRFFVIMGDFGQFLPRHIQEIGPIVEPRGKDDVFGSVFGLFCFNLYMFLCFFNGSDRGIQFKI